MLEKKMRLSASKVALVVVLSFVLVLLIGMGMASANTTYFGQIPAGYEKSCNLCHTSPPTLNDFGKKFKADGFKFPAKAEPAKPAATAPKTDAKAAPAATKPAPVAAKPAPKLDLVKVDLFSDGSLKNKKSVQAVQENGEILVPIRDVVDLLGGSVVSWDAKTKTVNFNLKGKAIALNLAKGSAKVGDKEFTGVAAKLAGGKSYVSLSFLGERLDTLLTLSFEANGKLDKSAVVRAKWSQSPHATPVASPVGRDTCVACHNGDGFAQGVTKVADLKDVNKDDPKGQYCTTCHGDRGKQIRNGGVATLANNKTVTLGRGALCASCHNSRRNNSDIAGLFAKKSAPHVGPQADVLTATGGMEFEGHVYPSSPHNANPNTCVTCHMAKDENGIANHSWKITSNLVANTCGSCHNGLTTVNRTALGDYDGDGKTEGIQDEVQGLQHLVEQAISASVGGGIHESHGAFEFTNAAGEVVDVSQNVYQAAWNLGLTENDGSQGVHNPAYVVTLLQQSYKAVTGKDVPGARIR